MGARPTDPKLTEGDSHLNGPQSRSHSYFRWRIRDLTWPDVMLLLFFGPVAIGMMVMALLNRDFLGTAGLAVLVLVAVAVFMYPYVSYHLLARTAPGFLSWLKPGASKRPPKPPWETHPK